VRHDGAKRLLVAAFVFYVGGFAVLWLPDRLACARVQRFQLHALFHLTSTVGPWSLIQHCVFAFHDRAHAEHRPARRGAAPASVRPARPQLAYHFGGALPIVELLLAKAV